MSWNVDPSPYAPPAVASAPESDRVASPTNEGRVRLLPGWVWFIPALGVAGAILLALDVRTPLTPLGGSFVPAILIASVALLCVFASINNFRRARFSWSRARRLSGWWLASIGTIGMLAAVHFGILAATFAWIAFRALFVLSP